MPEMIKPMNIEHPVGKPSPKEGKGSRLEFQLETMKTLSRTEQIDSIRQALKQVEELDQLLASGEQLGMDVQEKKQKELDDLKELLTVYRNDDRFHDAFMEAIEGPAEARA